MLRLLTLLIAAGLAAAACAGPGQTKARKRPPPDCSSVTKGGHYWLSTAPAPARQGQELIVSVWKAGDRPDAETLVPAGCLSDWKVSDPAVEVASDGVGLRIAPDAKPGTFVDVSAAIGGTRAKTRFVIVGAKDATLTGLWREVGSPDCPRTEPPLLDLEFTDDGRFMVTWVPFETYVDYWGEHVFDPGAGTLKMRIDRGNNVPTDAKLEGAAMVGPDGLLTLTGIDFGDRKNGRAPARCLAFSKLR